MIRELLLIHHSHVDIGYTHPQPVVMELNRRHIDLALDYAEQTQGWPEGSRFKWTCEVTGTTVDWWKHAANAARDRFVAATRAGRFEVAGQNWNWSQLLDHQMVRESLKPIAFFRSQGIPVRWAMNTDINGVPWGFADALLDHGIEGFSMSVNEHFGNAVTPRPGAFWWETPSGRRLLVHSGLMYGHIPANRLQIPKDLAHAASAVPALARELDEAGYPYSFLMLQVTNIDLVDNASPNLELSHFVRRWNEAGYDIGMRIVTLAEVFARLQSENLDQIPTQRGDWTDWWSFGGGGTVREAALALEGQRLLRDAQGLQAWPGGNRQVRTDMLLDRASTSLTLYAEHTYTADRAAVKPDSPETLIQIGLKKALAYEGVCLARMVRRDGLERLAQMAGGEALTALWFNPLPFPVRQFLRVPDASLLWRSVDVPQHNQHRLDVELNDFPDTEARWVGPIEVPALGYVTMPYDTMPGPIGSLSADPAGIGNAQLTLRFDTIRGGVVSFAAHGREFVRPAAEWRFCVPVLERPADGRRQAIYGPPDFRVVEVNQFWHTDWAATRDGPACLIDSRETLAEGVAEYVQSFEMTTGDRLTLTYRLLADDAFVQLDVVLEKRRLADPHALYLPMPLAMSGEPACHYETAGAMVELDREQLPGVSRHFITTQRLIRLQDAALGLTVACPDTPLWQIGGFTFGRHQHGEVKRDEPMLLAWLFNNYWDTNFEVDQSGQMKSRFRLIPHLAQTVGQSVRAALPHVAAPGLHVYRGRGPTKLDQASLLAIEASEAMLVGMEKDDTGVLLLWLNPVDRTLDIRIGPGVCVPKSATIVDLAGKAGERLPCDGGEVNFQLTPRAWVGLRLEVCP